MFKKKLNAVSSFELPRGSSTGARDGARSGSFAELQVRPRFSTTSAGHTVGAELLPCTVARAVSWGLCQGSLGLGTSQGLGMSHGRRLQLQGWDGHWIWVQRVTFLGLFLFFSCKVS